MYKSNRQYNYKRAPRLVSSGEKFREDFTMGKAIMPHELVMACSICIDNRDFAAYKLMMFLCTNADGFGLATETICKRCGISKPTYIDARKKLIEKGWISFNPRKSIVVHYDKIYSDYEAKLAELNITEQADDSDENREATEKARNKIQIIHDLPEEPEEKPNEKFDDSAFSAVFNNIEHDDFFLAVKEPEIEETKEENQNDGELPFDVV